MVLSKEVIELMNRSVLCWLASVSSELQPNVSPKEIFKYYEADEIIIANIASPQSVKNIQSNPKVCLSFIDILVQKGFQLKGSARILLKEDKGYKERELELLKMTQGNFPFASITNIQVSSIKKILAPRYLLFPNTTEEEQVKQAKISYGFR